MTLPDAASLKKRARIEALMLRDGAHAAAAGNPGGATRHLLSALARFHGRVIAGYLPMRSEIDPLPAMARLCAGGPVVVPVVSGNGRTLVFRRWMPGCALEPGPHGTRHPASGEHLDPEALIVPLVAFDRLGHRLGYGGGFYDRTLADLRDRGLAVHVVGFAWAAQEMAALPVEDFDARLDCVVTEQGVVAGD